MNDITIAVGGAECGVTPPMPYVGERFDGSVFTALAKLYTEAALLRCGFDTVDIPRPISDNRDAVMAANHIGADGTVIISYASFGSGKSFNDVCGCVAEYADGRTADSSRVLAEDICAKLRAVKNCVTAPAPKSLGGALCPTVVIKAGYLTDFDEGRLVYDPDYAETVAEHVAMGICENYSMPYILPNDMTEYPALYNALGKRGKKIKPVQALLTANGYRVDVDGVYGKNTDTALKEFCINNDIDVKDGDTVYKKLLLTDPGDTELGSRAAEALYIQRKLRAKLFRAPLSGVICDDTMHALGEFLSAGAVHIEDGKIPANAVKLLSPLGGCKPRLF